MDILNKILETLEEAKTVVTEQQILAECMQADQSKWTEHDTPEKLFEDLGI